MDDYKAFMTILGFGMLGVIFAGILKALYDNGIVVDEMITGSITITDLMTFLVLVWTIIGVMIALLRR